VSDYPVVGLAYLVIEAPDLQVWEDFARDVMGLQVRREAPGLRVRMDAWRQRFFVRPGPADDVVAIGWQVRDDAHLDALLAGAAGLHEASPQDAADRGVSRLARGVDPAGVPVELVVGPDLASEPFHSALVPSGFITGDQGMGHCVVTSDDPAASMAFYRDALGFKESDRIVTEYFGYQVDLDFLHTGPRHHSVAFGGPQQKRIHHFMLEVGSLDDVGACLDRCLRSRTPIVNTLGRHPNDRMVSFYAVTPSGFEFEFGWGARTIGADEDASWRPETYDRVSDWGHHPPMVYAPRRPK